MYETGANQLEYIHCRMVQSYQRYSKNFDLENEVRPCKQSTLEDQATEQFKQSFRTGHPGLPVERHRKWELHPIRAAL